MRCFLVQHPSTDCLGFGKIGGHQTGQSQAFVLSRKRQSDMPCILPIGQDTLSSVFMNLSQTVHLRKPQEEDFNLSPDLSSVNVVNTQLPTKNLLVVPGSLTATSSTWLPFEHSARAGKGLTLSTSGEEP